jgi:hypothetical protein
MRQDLITENTFLIQFGTFVMNQNRKQWLITNLDSWLSRSPIAWTVAHSLTRMAKPALIDWMIGGVPPSSLSSTF